MTPALRPGPSIAAGVLASAVGLLALGQCATTTSMTQFLALSVGWWWFAAACLFAANQAWIGRSRAERLRVFALCVGIAGVPMLPVAFVVAVNVFEALGGHP